MAQSLGMAPSTSIESTSLKTEEQYPQAVRVKHSLPQTYETASSTPTCNLSRTHSCEQRSAARGCQEVSHQVGSNTPPSCCLPAPPGYCVQLPTVLGPGLRAAVPRLGTAPHESVDCYPCQNYNNYGVHDYCFPQPEVSVMQLVIRRAAGAPQPWIRLP